GSLPLPLLVPRGEGGSNVIEEGVVAAAGHLLKRLGPAVARVADRPDGQRAAPGGQIDLAHQSGFFEQWLGDADTLRIPDANNARLHGDTSRTYNVYTGDS